MMKQIIVLLMILSVMLVLASALAQSPVAIDKPSFECKGLGLSMADWERIYGERSPSDEERDAVQYQDGKYVTRHWYANSSFNRTRQWKFSEGDYNVKYIHVTWGEQQAKHLEAARVEVKALIPSDYRLISTSSKPDEVIETYSSESLKTRFFPLYGGDVCISPWGIEAGVFKVIYQFHEDRIFSLIMTIGEPHETNIDECKVK